MRSVVFLAAALGLAACATAPDQASTEGRDCFYASSVTGYNMIDDRHVGVSVGANRSYILETMFNANDLDWTQAIALRSTTGHICTGSGVGVEIIGGEPRRTYPVVSITRASEEPAVEGS